MGCIESTTLGRYKQTDLKELDILNGKIEIKNKGKCFSKHFGKV